MVQEALLYTITQTEPAEGQVSTIIKHSESQKVQIGLIKKSPYKEEEVEEEEEAVAGVTLIPPKLPSY